MNNKIKVLRAMHELTQEGLAKKIGISRQSIVAIEKGKFNPSTLLSLKMAHILETSVDDLFVLEKSDW
ncbi:UNVERIFIED_CONTAM: hypothetical protein GTU68_051002 [Idotea baltica]|nr:hypothetical protein [Idotea baltica]